VGCFDGVHYIAQEYVSGQNLREYLAREGLPDLRLAVKVMCSVAAALHRAAERGIVHRDIKPENIMLAKNGEVKVADFGLARRTQEEALNLTQIGQTMGTPLYMSPEQAEGKQLDPRSDIYSLGVTCYHMLTGSPPFRGETALSVAMQHLNAQPERLENRRPDLPPLLCRVVHRMLAKDPASRYASGRDLLRDLRALRADLNGDAQLDEIDDGFDAADTPLSGRSRATDRLDALTKTAMLRRTRRRRTGRWALAALVAFGLGGLAAQATRPQSLLEGAAPDAAHVEQQGSARAQVLYASLLKSEDGWKAVLTHWPQDRYAVYEARRELGMLYLQQGKGPKAWDQFEILSDLRDGTEAEFRAVGLAGQAIVLTLDREYRQSNEKLAELFPLMDKLDQRLVPVVEQVMNTNAAQLNQKNELLEQWFKAIDSQEPVD
jgi:serine/threonine-protein kinase